MKLVIVTWEDIVVTNGWNVAEEAIATEPELVKSVGWVLYEDSRKIILSHGTGSSDDHNPTSTIPKGCVTDIKVLEE